MSSTDWTFYDDLGVAENATPKEINDAFRVLANQLHPDHQSDQSPQHLAQCAERLKEVTEAAATLRNAQKRAQYDQLLADHRAKKAAPQAPSGAQSAPPPPPPNAAQSAPSGGSTPRSAPPPPPAPPSHTPTVGKRMRAKAKPLAMAAVLGVAGFSAWENRSAVRDRVREYTANGVLAEAPSPPPGRPDTAPPVTVLEAPPAPPTGPPQWTARLDMVSRSGIGFAGEYPQFVDGDPQFNDAIRASIRNAIAEATVGQERRSPPSAAEFESYSTSLDSRIAQNDTQSVSVVLDFKSTSPYAREAEYSVTLTYQRGERRITRTRSMPRMLRERLWGGYYVQVAVGELSTVVWRSQQLREKGYPAFVLLAGPEAEGSFQNQSLLGPFRSRSAADSGAYGLGVPFRTVTFDSVRHAGFASR